jgi:CPA1 family monovalent cation:H+ antiporter
MVQARRRVDPPLLANTLTLLMPFTSFLIAEKLGASGVQAAVVAGLMMS